MNGTIFQTIQYPHRLSLFLKIVDSTKSASQVFHIFLWLFLIFCGFCTNGVFLATLRKTPQLSRRTINRLLMIISIVDLLILTNELLFIVYPFFVRHVPWQDSFYSPLVVGSVWFYIIFEHISEGLLVAIAYERFRAICFPLKNLSESRMLAKSLAIVVVIAVSFTSFFAYIFYCAKSTFLVIFFVLLIAPSAIPFLISTVLYTCVIYVVLTVKTDRSATDKRRIKKRNNLALQVIPVLATNTLVYFVLSALRKYFDTVLGRSFSEISASTEDMQDAIDHVWHWASYMAICTILNSAVNPIIYNIGGQEYRKALCNSFSLGCLTRFANVIGVNYSHPKIRTNREFQLE
ncbi:hypothetical protein HOLleu_07728 [Holothuria leucospilota]|uniref:G-protein coupled receptors family 1 profile domain-containing protein n=1 Tax=Holothuria leucospilota TaxID=206669 RepID=A0A9Q1CI03_HOLLE|nr:hypothetical protein HOLleu_07728 [Holothuria leucospilota]